MEGRFQGGFIRDTTEHKMGMFSGWNQTGHSQFDDRVASLNSLLRCRQVRADCDVNVPNALCVVNLHGKSSSYGNYNAAGEVVNRQNSHRESNPERIGLEPTALPIELWEQKRSAGCRVSRRAIGELDQPYRNQPTASNTPAIVVPQQAAATFPCPAPTPTPFVPSLVRPAAWRSFHHPLSVLP